MDRIRLWRMFPLLMLLGVPHYAAAQCEPPASPGPSSQDAAATAERPVSWSELIPNIASDQKRIWFFPASVVHGKHWKAVLAVTAATAALVALDPVDGTYFRRTTDFRRFNVLFSGTHTSLGVMAVPVSFYVAGLISKNSYARNTALLAGEAVADAEILTLVLKNATHRLRPAAIPAHYNLWDTWFEDKGYTLGGAGSFPSGHTIAAFSVATVFSRRYGSHRWVPYVAYGLAGMVGFSRVTLLSHFPSDVFMGAALGYSISRFAVLR
jgi:membrane-associated phospholipid phosphatase